jgi:hypothetical protein
MTRKIQQQQIGRTAQEIQQQQVTKKGGRIQQQPIPEQKEECSYKPP